MKQYKYSLDKSTKKFICPQCQKKTFVKYIQSETGIFADANYGRCDRETNCAYHSIPTGEYKNSFEIVNIPTPKPTFHSFNLVSECGRNYEQNNFVQFLRSLFADEEVQQAILKYLIGTSKRWHGAAIFWQIDNQLRVRAGKVLQYDAKTGRRGKDQNGKPSIDWVHSILKRNNAISDFTLKQCLFGLHLINANDSHTIGLVEGEKTAIIMSIFKPEYIRLATGSKSGLKYEFLLPIKKYRIVAFPDKSEYNDWLDKATDLNKFGFNITVNDWLEQKNHYANGTDLADVYIDVKDNVTYSDTEYAIHRIEKHKPEIWELINTFDLVDYYGNDIKKMESDCRNLKT